MLRILNPRRHARDSQIFDLLLIRNDKWTHKCFAFISSRHSPSIFESASTLSCKHDVCNLFRICNSHCYRGDGEIRTLDPLLARQVLSQLSYTPIGTVSCFFIYM